MNPHEKTAYLADVLEDTRLMHARLTCVIDETPDVAHHNHLSVCIKKTEDLIVSLSVAVKLARNEAREQEFRTQRPALLDQLAKSIEARRCERIGSNVIPFTGPEPFTAGPEGSAAWSAAIVPFTGPEGGAA